MRYDGNPYCQNCIDEDVNNNVKPIKRRVQTLPCPIHGHPGWLLPHLRVWVDFYNVIAPYSTSQTLDHALISKICTDYEIRFTDAFYWLSIIHQEVIKKYDHTRDRGSKETDESEGRGL